MKSVIKWIFKIIIGFLLLIIFSIFSYYVLYKFRQSIKYKEKITVKAYYMRYACGDCSIDMNVEWVNNNKYKFLLGHDIFPTTQKKDRGCAKIVSSHLISVSFKLTKSV